MNNFLIKYFEIVGFILGIIIGLSINWITDFYKVNIYFSGIILLASIILFIYGFITKNKLLSFEYNIEKGKWLKESIYDKEVWICENNPTFQIRKGNDFSDFTEKWTQIYPDSRGSGKYSIELIINGVIIKTLSWIYCDGGRISVPLPEIEELKNDEFDNHKIYYFWKKDSIEFKIAKIIGEFYIYNNIEGIAKISKIEIK